MHAVPDSAAAAEQLQQHRHLVACWRHLVPLASVAAAEVADVMAAPGSYSEGAWGVQGGQEALEQKKKVHWQIQEGLGVLGILGAQGARRKMEAQVALGALGVFEGPQAGAQN